MAAVIKRGQGYKSIHGQLDHATPHQLQKVCSFWKSGSCRRYRCPFLHAELPPQGGTISGLKRCHDQLPVADKKSRVWINPNPPIPTLDHHDASSKANLKPNPKPLKRSSNPINHYACSKANPNPDPKPLKPNSNPINHDDCSKANTNPKPTSNPVNHDACSKAKPNPNPNLTPIPDHHVASAKDDPNSNANTNPNPNPPDPECHDASFKPSPSHKDTYLKHGCGHVRIRHPHETLDKVCANWLAGKCDQGDSCKLLHSWFVGQSFESLAVLEGHKKAVSGIVLPSGSNKLFSGSKDESVRVWDCYTGKCAGVLNLGGDIGCIISEGPWLFMGIPNAIKAWNPQNAIDLSLSGPFGQVCALSFNDEMLFAGTQDGTILSWNYDAVQNLFAQAASLNGHTLSVVTLVSRATMLYSGSMDHTIKVWDLGTSQCMLTLTDHTSAVMSVLCWDQYLLSCSLDQTIKVWAATETGNLEVCYTHNVDHGLRALCGMPDEQDRPVLFCSCDDNSVRLYDLPSFGERGKIFSKEEVCTIQVGPDGLVFTGDATGKLRVWKMLTKEPAVTS